MRIIGGIFKGRKLFLPIDKKTRPLKDLAKEAIFNLINHSNKINCKIENSIILDLFAGTGSFGIECLSRKALKVIFFENYIEALKILEKNLNSLKNIKNYEVVQNDCFDLLKYEKIKLKFNIIFIDPPFKEIKINEIIEKIKERDMLRLNGIIIVHRHKNDKLKFTEKVNIIEERLYGISKISFLN